MAAAVPPPARHLGIQAPFASVWMSNASGHAEHPYLDHQGHDRRRTNARPERRPARPRGTGSGTGRGGGACLGRRAGPEDIRARPDQRRGDEQIRRRSLAAAARPLSGTPSRGNRHGPPGGLRTPAGTRTGRERPPPLAIRSVSEAAPVRAAARRHLIEARIPARCRSRRSHSRPGQSACPASRCHRKDH